MSNCDVPVCDNCGAEHPGSGIDDRLLCGRCFLAETERSGAAVTGDSVGFGYDKAVRVIERVDDEERIYR